MVQHQGIQKDSRLHVLFLLSYKYGDIRTFEIQKLHVPKR